uniref:Uncharacterized protein n=1 Tax=Caenorhabditis japonica TaxID=281687 RepID=A0A8R1HZD1_CAEJA
MNINIADVKLVLPALDLIPSTHAHEKTQFGTAIVFQLLYFSNEDHLAVEKLQTLLDSDKLGQINSGRLHGQLLKFLRCDGDKSPDNRVKIVSKILALEFPKDAKNGNLRFGGRNLTKFLSNDAISVENAKKIVSQLENEQRVYLSTEEIAEARQIMQAVPEKADLIGKLRKSATLQRWRAGEVKDLLQEHDNLPKEVKVPVKMALREVILQKVIGKSAKEENLDFLVSILERVVEWRKEEDSTKKNGGNFNYLCKTLEAVALTEAVSSNDMVLADRIWQMRSSQAPTADVLLSYASRLFVNGEIERADEVCEVLRNSSQTIRPQTLEKMGRHLKGVDTNKMHELATYLGKSFNLREKDTRRVVLQAKTDQLHQLIQRNVAEQKCVELEVKWQWSAFA